MHWIYVSDEHVYDTLYECDFCPVKFSFVIIHVDYCEDRFRSITFHFCSPCLPSNPEILFIGLFYYNIRQDFWTSGDSKVQGLQTYPSVLVPGRVIIC